MFSLQHYEAALASDPNNFEKWLTLHQKWKSDIPAELSEGAQITEVISMMGTSISFYRGPEFTESLRRAMQEATGVPCTTSLLAKWSMPWSFQSNR